MSRNKVPRKGNGKVGGETAKARWAFYKRLVELGCTYCAECRCYQFPSHTCEGLAWLRPNGGPEYDVVGNKILDDTLQEEETYAT